MYKILIVEDNDLIKTELKRLLEANGFEVHLADDENDIFNYLDLDCVLLDLNLWQHDGIYLAKKIRANSTIPIIVLTSRDNPIDELMAIEIGADDYITKPYHPHLLIARISAVLRRTHSFSDNYLIQLGHYRLNLLEMTFESYEKLIQLSANETKILHYLMIKHPAAVTRENLMEHLWSEQYFVDDNTLTVNVNRIRKKMETEGINNCIETVRGVGYRFK